MASIANLQATAPETLDYRRGFDREEATRQLRAFANPHRFMILLLLREDEHSVSALEQAVGIRQPSMSQQLARLREDGLVVARRDGKSIYYSLADRRTELLVDELLNIFSR